MAKDDESFKDRNVSDDKMSLGRMTTTDISLLDAVDLPIIVISRDCRIARINRASTTVLRLAASDVGCTLGKTLVGVEDLDRICARVITDGAPHRIETRDGDRRFLLRIAPYAGNDGQIQGAVLTFTNVTAFRASIDQAIYEREYTKAILNTVTDPLVVLDAKLQVHTANRAFYALFGLSRDQAQGISIRGLGNNEWETSELWKSIEATVSDHTPVQAVEIEREFPTIGIKNFVLDARRLARDGADLILLTFRDVTQHKRAERATSLLAAIVESSDDAIISKKLDGTITSWNKGAERLFGYTPEEAIGQHITLIVPWERRAEEEDILRRLAGGERVDHFETVRKRRDGTTLEVSLTISPVRDAAGKVIGASKVARDISERRRAERALSEQGRLLDLSNDAIFIRDAADRVTYWNTAATELYGFTREEALGRITHELLQTQFPAPLEKIKERLHREERWSGELVHTRKDGAKVIVSSRWVLDREANGNAWRILETNNDITQQKQTGKALRESEQRYRVITEAAPIMVWMSGLDKLCYYFNKGWLDFVGRTLAEECGNEWAKGIHPDDFDRCLQIYASNFDARRSFEMQYRLKHHSGQYRWILDHGVPRYAPDGAFEGYVGGCLDIHDQKEAEEKYRKLAQTLEAEVRSRTRELEEQSNQVRDLSWRLLRSQDEERRHIARELHDSVGQMLAAVSMNIAAIRDHRLDPQVAQSLSESASFIDQISREIRTISHLLHPPLLEVAGLMSAIRWYVDGFSERSGIKVDLDLPEHFSRLPDEMEITIFRLIQECLTNIHRHSGSYTARVAIREKQPELVVEVKDWGKGIPPSKQRELSLGRMGVGFRGMRERLKQFEGKLEIQSDGDGTLVTARMQLAPEPAVDPT